MSFFRNREGKEVEKQKVNENKIRDPEQPTIEAKNKLNASEREKHNAFVEKYKVDQSKENDSEKKKIQPNAGDPNRGQRQREIGHVTDDGR